MNLTNHQEEKGTCTCLLRNLCSKKIFSLSLTQPYIIYYTKTLCVVYIFQFPEHISMNITKHNIKIHSITQIIYTESTLSYILSKYCKQEFANILGMTFHFPSHHFHQLWKTLPHLSYFFFLKCIVIFWDIDTTW